MLSAPGSIKKKKKKIDSTSDFQSILMPKTHVDGLLVFTPIGVFDDEIVQVIPCHVVA